MTTHLTIELVFDSDCPHVGQARSAIDAALRELQVLADCKEWNRADDSTPSELRGYGSPTVLINRRDVENLGPDDIAAANSCRVYRDECGGLRGAPTVQQIVAALTEAKRRQR